MQPTKRCSYATILDEDEKEAYHCPREVWTDGNDEEFCLFHSNYLDRKTDQFNAEILRALKGSPSHLFRNGQRKDESCCDFLGFKFPDGCNAFDHHVIKQIDKHIIFEDCYFEGDFSLSFLEFDDQLEFNSSAFEGCLVISYAKLNGNLFIKDISLDGFLDLSGTRILGHLIIDKCKSDCYVVMNRLTVENTARISGVECAYWLKAENSKTGSFLTVNKCVSDSISIKESEIKGDLIFSGCRSKKEIDCSGCREINSFQVEDCEATTLNARGLIYSGILTLSSLCLNGDMDNASDFTDVVLEKSSFIGTDLGTVAFSRAVIREASFDRVTFGLQRRALEKLWKKILLPAWKPAQYRKDWSALSYFSGRPKEMILEEARARANNSKEERVTQFETAEKVYRSLKHEMEKQHAGNLARRMRAGELECKIHGRYSLPDKFFLSLYRSINGYGLRWFRALVILFVLILGFSFFYYDKIATYEMYSVETNIREVHSTRTGMLEAFWHSLEMTSIIAKPSVIIEDPTIRYMEGIERVICPLILLMFIQAFRNTVRD